MKLPSKDTSKRRQRNRRKRRKEPKWMNFATFFILVLVLIYFIFLVRFLPNNEVGSSGKLKRPFQALRSRSSLKKLPVTNEVPGIESLNEIHEKKIEENSGEKNRPGFVVLGMHRSGTSMLSGLMVMGLGYNVGEPLIGGAYDNPKGFFELLPVVLQNDIFMGKQNIGWDANVIHFDYNLALKHKEANAIKFKEGSKGLRFLNDPTNYPWLQKDPRMCITLRLWLELLDEEPAILYTYRHPVEVANSLEKRAQSVEFFTGLRLWIVYNMRAIQNSAELCRVTSSNVDILTNPLTEIQRLSDELTKKCGVPAPPRRLDQSAVDKFLDPNLQHKRGDEMIETEIIATYGEDCVVYDIKHKYGYREEFEQNIYLKAMKLYCDLENGSAFKDDYEWPNLQ